MKANKRLARFEAASKSMLFNKAILKLNGVWGTLDECLDDIKEVILAGDIEERDADRILTAISQVEDGSVELSSKIKALVNELRRT